MSTENTSSQIRDRYNKTAGNWREKVWVSNSEFQEQIHDFAELDNPQALLDVGIGSGDFSAIFNANDVTGLDISKGMLQECHNLHPDFKLVLGNAEGLPFVDNIFENVICRNCLQNFEDPTNAFGEMVRVLKPGGKLVVVESAVYDNEREFPTQFCRISEPYHPLFPSHEKLRGLFEYNNISSITQEVAGVRKKWLAKWQISKGASDKERLQGYNICLAYPDWYKDAYQFEFFPEEVEIQSKLTFSLLKGIKKS